MNTFAFITSIAFWAVLIVGLWMFISWVRQT